MIDEREYADMIGRGDRIDSLLDDLACGINGKAKHRELVRVVKGILDALEDPKKKEPLKGSAQATISLDDGVLRVTCEHSRCSRAGHVLIERDIFEGEWSALFSMLRGDE